MLKCRLSNTLCKKLCVRQRRLCLGLIELVILLLNFELSVIINIKCVSYMQQKVEDNMYQNKNSIVKYTLPPFYAVSPQNTVPRVLKRNTSKENFEQRYLN